MKNYIVLALAIAAGLAAFIITKSHIVAYKKALQLQAEKVSVLALTRDKLAGDMVVAGDVTTRQIFKSDLPGHQVMAKDSRIVLNRRLAYPLRKNSILRYQDFEDDIGANRNGSPIARRVKKFERGLSLSVDQVSCVSGLIRPNDHVDILGTFRFPVPEGGAGSEGPSLDTVTLTLLQNVTVIAVGKELAYSQDDRFTSRAARANRGGSYATITVLVTPKEAEMLVFAQQKGDLTMTARRPDDIYFEEDIQDVDFSYLKTNLKMWNSERKKRITSPKSKGTRR